MTDAASARTRVSYLVVLLGATALLLALAASFNAVVDPYGLFRIAEIQGINQYKTQSKNSDRMHKARAVLLTRPDAIVISSSRGFALYPDHPGWRADVERPYNLSLAGTNIVELEQYIEFAQRQHPLKQLVIGLGFHMFKLDRVKRAALPERLRPENDGRWLLGEDVRASLLSATALDESVKTIARQSEGRDRDVILAGGELSLDGSARFVREMSARGAFQFAEEHFLSNVWPSEEGSGSFSREADGSSPGLASLARIVALARRDGIDLRLFLSPVHARLLETIRASGLWDEFESWKRGVVEVLAEDARAHPGAPPIPLWDFSGYNSITVEDLPPEGDHDSLMHWYFEASHYNKRAGDLILDRVLGYTDPARPVPEDFGIRLDGGNIDSWIARTRERGERYRASHPGDVDEVWQARTASPSERRSAAVDDEPRG